MFELGATAPQPCFTCHSIRMRSDQGPIAREVRRLSCSSRHRDRLPAASRRPERLQVGELPRVVSALEPAERREAPRGCPPRPIRRLGACGERAGGCPPCQLRGSLHRRRCSRAAIVVRIVRVALGEGGRERGPPLVVIRRPGGPEQHGGVERHLLPLPEAHLGTAQRRAHRGRVGRPPQGHLAEAQTEAVPARALAAGAALRLRRRSGGEVEVHRVSGGRSGEGRKVGVEGGRGGARGGAEERAVRRRRRRGAGARGDGHRGKAGRVLLQLVQRCSVRSG
ncbi:hypothetical protein DFJ74DRAFT_399775 [Hyaloraphidium curvatum]|nr:hypothetical protein DFJ74DRAFT_399775 [Hyaloraphidium curvatum]